MERGCRVPASLWGGYQPGTAAEGTSHPQKGPVALGAERYLLPPAGHAGNSRAHSTDSVCAAQASTGAKEADCDPKPDPHTSDKAAQLLPAHSRRQQILREATYRESRKMMLPLVHNTKTVCHVRNLRRCGLLAAMWLAPTLAASPAAPETSPLSLNGQRPHTHTLMRRNTILIDYCPCVSSPSSI